MTLYSFPADTLDFDASKLPTLSMSLAEVYRPITTDILSRLPALFGSKCWLTDLKESDWTVSPAGFYVCHMPDSIAVLELHVHIDEFLFGKVRREFATLHHMVHGGGRSTDRKEIQSHRLNMLPSPSM